MTSYIKLSVEIKAEVSSSVPLPLMVCSHERSGTHFLMNSLANRTNYTSNPYLNYDLYPLGTFVNFFDKTATRNFLDSLSRTNSDGDQLHTSSIIKSHFWASHLEYAEVPLPVKFIYIWREPAATLVSFWRYLHSCQWDEGPKTATPLELAQSRPSGQSQRYQSANHTSYFSRWANHVSDGISFCARHSDACIVRYEDLVRNYNQEMIDICQKLGIQDSGSLEVPDRTTNVIAGANLELAPGCMDELRSFCDYELQKFPELQELINRSCRVYKL